MNSYSTIATNLQSGYWQVGQTMFPTWDTYLRAENVKAEFPGVPFYNTLMNSIPEYLRKLMTNPTFEEIVLHCTSQIDAIPRQEHAEYLKRTSVVWQPPSSYNPPLFYNPLYEQASLPVGTLTQYVILPAEITSSSNHKNLQLPVSSKKKQSMQPHVIICYFKIGRGKKNGVNTDKLHQYGSDHRFNPHSFASAFYRKVKDGLLEEKNKKNFTQALFLAVEKDTKEMISAKMEELGLM